MKFEDHCNETFIKLGNRFEEVHKWLDEFAGSKDYGMKHRKKRHHLEGVKEAEKLFGVHGGKAAKLHIISDLREEGWTENDPFPKDEKDYVKLGFF